MSGNLLKSSPERGRVMEFAEGRDGVYAATDRSVVWFDDRRDGHDIPIGSLEHRRRVEVHSMASKSISASGEGSIWSSYFNIHKIYDRKDGRFFQVVPGTRPGNARNVSMSTLWEWCGVPQAIPSTVSRMV